MAGQIGKEVSFTWGTERRRHPEARHAGLRVGWGSPAERARPSLDGTAQDPVCSRARLRGKKRSWQEVGSVVHFR